MVAADADGGDPDAIADDNDDVTADADRVRYRGADRLGGTLSVIDRRIVIRDDAADDDGRAVPLTVVEELTHRSVDWFTLLLGIGIVAFGLVSIPRNRVGAAAFVLAGAVSLAVTWRRRGRVRIHTHGRPKPVTVYPSDPEGFLAAVDEALAGVRSEQSLEDGSSDESDARDDSN